MVISAAGAALAATYFLGRSDLDITAKTRGFSGVIAGFLIFCVCSHLWQSSRRSRVDSTEVSSDDDIEHRLHVLEEANEFFAGSLKASDTFRLVASRIRDLIPYRTIVLYLLDETRTYLKVAGSDGADSAAYQGLTLGLDSGLVGKCFSSGQIETDENGSAAVPLRHGFEVYGVLQMDNSPDSAKFDHSLLESIGTRVAPLILSSISFERSLTNALTDPTTDLPNERAFYLILENQIAESQRKGEMRPLTILAIDIRNFDEINQRFGHAAGDRVLNFAAQDIKDNLRQMDFFARAMDDEFIAILPTASKEVSHEVMARVHTGFFGRKLKISESDAVEIELNIGWAAFGDDGETPDQLLTAARVRKEQVKSAAPHKVLWFPQESAN